MSGEHMDNLEQGMDDEPKRSMDTPLLIAALLIAGAMLAYFFFGKDSAVVESEPPMIVEATPEEEQIQAVIASDSVSDELLTRARLAVQSGMLVEPSSNNALYYYSLYLEQNPDNADAEAELAAAVSEIGELVATAVAEREWQRAAFLSEQISNAGVTSSAVDAYRSDLEQFREAQGAAAIAAARRGAESDANEILDALAELPRAEPAALLETRSAVRDALVAYRVDQQAAAEAAAARRERQQRERQQAAAQARSQQATPPPATASASVDPLSGVRSALRDGSLTGPSGAIAQLSDVPADADGRGEVQAQLVALLGTEARNAAGTGDLALAESLQGEVAALDAAAASNLQATIDRAYIDLATAETVSAATLRRTQAVAPVYPRTALRRGLNGRLKVEFTVAADGTTRDIEVVETSASSNVFDRSAIRAVSEWRYEPREVRGQAVAQRVYAYLDYNLE
ncbi:MAG: energy transducer TonB [Pseudomonadota bacterium]